MSDLERIAGRINTEVISPLVAKKDAAIHLLRWLHAEAAFERDHLRSRLDAALSDRQEFMEKACDLNRLLRTSQREVDELQQEVMAHQVGEGYDKGHEHGSAVAARFKAERDAAEASRRDWAVEALAMTMAPVRAGELRQDEPYRPPFDGEVPCACISDDQAASLSPGFSRPVCAVHPTPSDLQVPPSLGAWRTHPKTGVMHVLMPGADIGECGWATVPLDDWRPAADGNARCLPCMELAPRELIDPTWQAVGGDPLSGTPWAEGGEPT